MDVGVVLLEAGLAARGGVQPLGLGRVAQLDSAERRAQLGLAVVVELGQAGLDVANDDLDRQQVVDGEFEQPGLGDERRDLRALRLRERRRL